MQHPTDSAATTSPGLRRLVPKSSVLWGAKAALLVAAIVVFADLPNRWAFAADQHRTGKSLPEYLAVGIAVDLFAAGGWIWPVVLGLLLGLSPGPAPRRRWRKAVAVAVPMGVLVLVWAALWIGGIAATEFRLQRGLYPTLEDLRMAGETSYWASAFRTFWFRRYLQPGLVAFPLVLAGLVGLGRLLVKRTGELRRLGVLVGYLSCAAGLWLAGWAFWFSSDSVLGTVLDRREVSLPIGQIFDVSATARNVRWGLRANVEQIQEPPALVARGAQMVGAPPQAARELATAPVRSCLPHPFRREMPLPERARVGSGQLAAAPAYDPRIIDALGAVSQALFSRGAPSSIHVWHLVLESFRAEELHAINPRAPRELAPFVNALYEKALPSYRSIALREVYQGGIRTSQALSALLCGLGSLPYDVSFARDIGAVPYRCLPDVLADAGFDTAFMYGEKPAFDNMLDFLTAHHVEHFIVKKNLPPGLPSGGWGVSDLALLRNGFPLREADTGGAARANAYSLVLTLTNHHPWGFPQDMPERVIRDVDGVLPSAPSPASPEDRARLITNAYTDEAVREFFEQLSRSPWADRSIVLVSADHSTNDPSAWAPPGQALDARERSIALTRIPAVIVVPQTWLEGLSDRGAADKAMDQAQQLLGDLPLSQNDLPAMMLALVSESSAMRGLGADERWHTMGGQRTSPYFRAEVGGECLAWGVDAQSHPFSVLADGTFHETGERCAPQVQDKSAAPTLEPVAGFLSVLLRNYDTPCHGVL